MVLISGIGSAAEIIVEPGNSIQTAINNANSGDTITIKSGTYTENLNITKGNLTIRSQSGNPDDTIIKSKNSKDSLLLQAYNVTIRGIKVTGSGSSYSGIYLYKSSNCVIENSKVMNNGYGIRFGSSTKCTVSKNTVMDNGVYGIYLGSSSRNTISGNTAYNSSSGIYMGSSDYNTISGNNVTFNNNLGFYECSLCDHNTVYNNYFNNIKVTVKGSENSFNVTKTAGANIIGGSYIGGNYWGKPDGTGFSDTAVDKDGDGISDSTYILPGGSTSTDYLPLVYPSNSPVPEPPVADFSSNVTSGTAPLSVQFTDLSRNAVSWSWDFGDGENSIEKNPIHTYSTAGTYTVNLTVSNANGTASKTATITVSEPPKQIVPVANFNSNVTSGNAPLSVQFTDTSQYATGWKWDFENDGTVDSIIQNPVKVYTASGTYTVNLTTVNVNGTSSKLMTITVYNPSEPVTPVADFTANTTSGYAPLEVQFTDLSQNATSWSWDFGDETNSIEKNPLHTYSNAGIYTVNLTVSNENGTNSKLATITVSEEPLTILPVANFSSNVSEGSAPLSVQFTDLSENTVSWSWDFDNNGQSDSTVQNPVYVYETPGDYTVNLTVSNANGTDSETLEIKVLEAGKEGLPVADFEANVTGGGAPLSVLFTDRSQNAVSFNWDFGDGAYSIGQNPVHTYSTAGIYTVNLTVSNENGIDSKLATINVSEKTVSILPVANFTANVSEGFAPLSVQFTDLSENAVSFNWDFGDGANSIEKNPIHTYSTAEKYNVTLTVMNDMGNSTLTKYHYIYVKEENDDDKEGNKETEPGCGETKPTCGETKPTCRETKPTCGETKTACGKTKPVCKETKPICEKTKPVCKETKPLCKPVCEDDKEVTKETKQVSEDAEQKEKEITENNKKEEKEEKEVTEKENEAKEDTKPVCEGTKENNEIKEDTEEKKEEEMDEEEEEIKEEKKEEKENNEVKENTEEKKEEKMDEEDKEVKEGEKEGKIDEEEEEIKEEEKEEKINEENEEVKEEEKEEKIDEGDEEVKEEEKIDEELKESES